MVSPVDDARSHDPRLERHRSYRLRGSRTFEVSGSAAVDFLGMTGRANDRIFLPCDALKIHRWGAFDETLGMDD